ncbi:hypothetical protein ACOME3_000133 [Neoechinorhynchus agilis]
MILLKNHFRNPMDDFNLENFPMPPMHLIAAYDPQRQSNRAPPAPPPIPESSYTSFGAEWQIDDIPMLNKIEEHQIPRLYGCSEPGSEFINDYGQRSTSTSDYKQELQKLNLALIVCFSDLMEILNEDPTSDAKEEISENIRIISNNVMHLLNCLRIQQAYGNMKVAVQLQLRAMEEMRDGAEREGRRIQEAVNAAISRTKTALDGFNEHVDVESVREIPEDDLELTTKFIESILKLKDEINDIN